MTDIPSIGAIFTAIKGLTITYNAKTLTILDLGEQPDAIDLRTCPVMFTDPENAVTNMVSSRSGMGPASAAGHDYTYTLGYYVAIYPSGSGRGLKDIMPDLIAWASTIVAAIETHDDGLVADNINAHCDVIGTITDPTGNVFHGLHMAVDVEEFQ